MTAAVIATRPAGRKAPRLAPRATTWMSGFTTLLADSIRLANALEAAPTAESRRTLTARFVEAQRAA